MMEENLEAAPVGAPGDKNEIGLARWDVLVVEDDRATREELARAFRDAGYTVGTAGDGREALEIIRTARIGVMVLDLMLPVMTGWQLLEALRASPTTSPVPTLIITAVSNFPSAPGGAVFLKPLNLSSLLRAVRAYLGT
jgi:DNA-binding response OmpR family regulator